MFGRKKIADKFPRCPKCRRKDWVAKTKAQLTGQINGVYVRQGFDCPNCNARALLGRLLSDVRWEFTSPAQ